MSGIHCRMSVCILTVLIMCKNRIYNDLVRAGCTSMRTCGLSISQRLPCPQPSELLLNLVKCTWRVANSCDMLL